MKALVHLLHDSCLQDDHDDEAYDPCWSGSGHSSTSDPCHSDDNFDTVTIDYSKSRSGINSR